MHRCILGLDGHTCFEVFTLVMYGYLGIQHIWASRRQAQTCMLFSIAVCASAWQSSLLFILFLQKKNYLDAAFPQICQIWAAFERLCVFKGARDNLKQLKLAGTWTAWISDSSRLCQGQGLVQSPGLSPRLPPLNLAHALGAYCTVSPNALKWASLAHLPQGLQ